MLKLVVFLVVAAIVVAFPMVGVTLLLLGGFMVVAVLYFSLMDDITRFVQRLPSRNQITAFECEEFRERSASEVREH